MLEFYFIGFGAVAHALVEMWNLEDMYMKNKITIIEPLDIDKWVFVGRKIKFIQKEITPKNCSKLLKDITENTIIIDLSVNVDCLMIVDECIKHNSFYVNTSVENYQDESSLNSEIGTTYEEIKEQTLYYRQRELNKKMKDVEHNILVNFGQNPGLVSLYAKCALKEIARQKNINFKSYADLAKELNLRKIVIAEIDTQLTILESDPDIYYSSWSSTGFMEEACDPIQKGFGTHETITNDMIFPTKNPRESNMMFMPFHGIDKTEDSTTLDDKGQPIDFTGYMIPHAEADSLSLFLQTKNNDYRPSVYYCYRPSQIALDSIESLKNNDYQFLEDWYVLELPDLISGYDSVGTLLIFEDNSRFWCGSVLSVEDVQKLGFKRSGPTVVQVATAINSSVKYFLKNKDEGLIDPEDLPLLVLEDAKKYLGSFHCKWI